MDKVTNAINALVDRLAVRQRFIASQLQGVPGELLVHLPVTDDPAELEKGVRAVLQRFAAVAPQAAAQRDREIRQRGLEGSGLTSGLAALAASTAMPDQRGLPAASPAAPLPPGLEALAAETLLPK